MTTALITGASAGLGRSLASALHERGWRLIIDARTARPLHDFAVGLGTPERVTAIAGDITDPGHRAELIAAARAFGGLDLLVNNASTLGPTPLPRLADIRLTDVLAVLNANLLAPLALIQLALPLLREAPDPGAVLNISSDAAVEGYPGWGGYGASKAALDQLTAVLAAEHPQLCLYAVDPGDMRTAMHQAAFPGEDISDRPEPDSVVPALLALLSRRPPSGRYRAADLQPPEAQPSGQPDGSDAGIDAPQVITA